MTRAEQLRYCKICTNQKFDRQQGIICQLTNQQADFEDQCDHFTENTEITGGEYLSDFEFTVREESASKGKRFANFLIDRIAISILTILLGIFLAVLSELFGFADLDLYLQGGFIIEYLLGVVIAITFYTLFEGTTGRTIGKYITKTKVVNEAGEKPSFKTILIRSCCRYVPFDAFSFLGSDDEGWHDRWSKTRVVKA